MAKNSERLTVDLSGLKLPEKVVDQIARSIQKAVLLEIASLDIAPDFEAIKSRSGNPIKIGDIAKTRGLILKESVKFKDG